MSNIYIQEPPTNGKVLLETTVGDIDVELWSKETPRACRNFVQLCMEGYYDNTIFHRVIRGFIAQGGDPTGTGLGGDSIYGAPFKDEFHSRLRFNRRGLLAMANSGVHDNSSQFFFTFAEARDLNSKHTIFGKVVGDTIYNMLKLENVEVDHEDRPLYPPRILKSQILLNPFDDIKVRKVKQEEPLVTEENADLKLSPSKAAKNFTLLSFGSDAEDEEEETSKLNNDIKGRSKSSHDISNDPKLSSQLALDETSVVEGDVPMPVTAPIEAPELALQDIALPEEPKSPLSKSEELMLEAKLLKREIQQSKMGPVPPKEAVPTERAADEITPDDNDMIAQYKTERLKYKSSKRKFKSPEAREKQTLDILHKFQSKLGAMRGVTSDGEDEINEAEVGEEDEFDASWLNHKLTFASGVASTVIDANIYEASRYDVHDPRNPLNKRKRDAPAENTKSSSKNKR